MEEAFVSLVTAFLLDNNDLMNNNNQNPLAHASDVQVIAEDEEGNEDHDCYDFIPSFKDFMVPQRDRAFSWDVSLENGLHPDSAGHPQIALHDHFPTHHQSSSSSSSILPNEDPTKLMIRAKFPTKSTSTARKGHDTKVALIPPIKLETISKESILAIDQLDHDDILEDDDNGTDEYLEDPLLLSIPADLLIDSQTPTTPGRKSKSRPVKEEKTTSKRTKSNNTGTIKLTQVNSTNSSENVGANQTTITPPPSSSIIGRSSQDLHFNIKAENLINTSESNGKPDVAYTNYGTPSIQNSLHSSGATFTSSSSSSYLLSMNNSNTAGAMNGGVKSLSGLNYSGSMGNIPYSNYNHPQYAPYTGNTAHHNHSHNHNHSHHGHLSGMHEKRVGIYTIEERRMKIEKFREKKRQRIWRKQIKYDCRKRLADTRPRVKGRFVSRKNQQLDASGNPFASPCGSKDATTNEQTDEDDSVGGSSSGLQQLNQQRHQQQTALKHPMNSAGLHHPVSSSLYGHQVIEKGEYSIGGGLLNASASGYHHHHQAQVHGSTSSLYGHYISPSYNTIGNTASLLNQSNTSAPRITTSGSALPPLNGISIGGSSIPTSSHYASQSNASVYTSTPTTSFSGASNSLGNNLQASSATPSVSTWQPSAKSLTQPPVSSNQISSVTPCTNSASSSTLSTVPAANGHHPAAAEPQSRPLERGGDIERIL